MDDFSGVGDHAALGDQSHRNHEALLDALAADEQLQQQSSLAVNGSSSNNNDGSASKQYVCEFCGRIFGRAEHLSRHVRSHDTLNQRPFECDICQKCFTRRDVLVRHRRAIHERAPPPKGTRRRSCVRCARYKIKCSGPPSCESCAKKEIVCEFADTGPFRPVLYVDQTAAAQRQLAGGASPPASSNIEQLQDVMIDPALQGSGELRASAVMVLYNCTGDDRD